MDRNLTTEEVADYFRTSPETVRYWRHGGRGPRSFKVGRRVLYREQDVLAFERSAIDANGLPTVPPSVATRARLLEARDFLARHVESGVIMSSDNLAIFTPTPEAIEMIVDALTAYCEDGAAVTGGAS